MLETGLLLVLIPWSAFWERNYFAELWPSLQAFLTNNFVRGAVTGLGVVNALAGCFELLSMYAARSTGPALSIHSSHVTEE